MAVKISRATGNWLTSGTWGTVDSTSYNNSESATTALTTSYQTSTTFTPGAIVIDGIAVKLSVRTGTTGTMTVALDQAGSDVSGTVVTINTADLPVAATTDANGGWIFFKFASPVTLTAATAYGVKAKTSSNSMVSLFSTATTNWSRALSTTTAGAPAAGDDIIICGEYTGAGTSNTITVTMDAIASSITDYGSASTSLVTPALAICSKGILTYGITASTNYYLRLSGNLIVYSDGNFRMGNTGSNLEIPRSSTAVLNFDCGANVAFGLTVRNLGTYTSQGLSRTSGKNIYYCRLNADSPANDLVMDVDTDTGWLDNDVIAVASTTRTPGQCEIGAVNVTVTSTQITVDGFGGTSGGLQYAHSGTSPTQARVILLTRNVQVFGASSTLQAYIDIKATATVDCDWTEYKWLGSNTANKRGIDLATTTGTCSFMYCSRHSSTVSGNVGWAMTGASGTGLTLQYNVAYNISDNHYTNVVTSGSSIISDNIFMYSTNNAQMVVLADVGGTFTNNIMIGCSSNAAFYVSENGAVVGTISGNEIHSGGSTGFNLVSSSSMIGVITNTTIWRQSGNGLLLTLNEIIFDGLTMFGNSTNVNFNSSGGVYKGYNWNLSGDSSFGTGVGINMANNIHITLTLINSDLGVATGIKTTHAGSDISCNTLCNPNIILINTKLGSSTEVGTQSSMIPSGFIQSQKHDKTAGVHKTWKRCGNLERDTGTVHTGSESLKMTPAVSIGTVAITDMNAYNKLESNSFYVAVGSGATVAPTVYVNKNSTYNTAIGSTASQPRLLVKRNDFMGITVDTVVATASAGANTWEALTGTVTPTGGGTFAVDGVLEFVIDCGGTSTGSVFVDSFSVA